MHKISINKQFKSYQKDVVKNCEIYNKAYWYIINRNCDSETVFMLILFMIILMEESGGISANQVSQCIAESNRELSELETKHAIKGLKKNKACADDDIRHGFM